MQLVYDGSFNGLLTVIFEVYTLKLGTVNILREQNNPLPDLFAENKIITTDLTKSERVWKSLNERLNKEARTQIYWSFLSELPDIDNHILNYLIYALRSANDISQDYTHPSVLCMTQTWKKVAREKHRFEAFVRFELIDDNFFYAPIEPDFNILPLIGPHFKRRYPAQSWIIYDLKRNYGLHYDCVTTAIQETTINFDDSNTEGKVAVAQECEQKYKDLWKNYFASVNISARKNMRLHIQHIPKRYWKYLTEKSL